MCVCVCVWGGGGGGEERSKSYFMSFCVGVLGLKVCPFFSRHCIAELKE